MTFNPEGPAPIDSGIFGLNYHESNSHVILIPVPFEATTSYRRGAAKGPASILKASRQVELFDLDVVRPYEVGITMLDESKEIVSWNQEACALATQIIASAGDEILLATLKNELARVNEISSALNQWVYKHVHTQLKQGKIPCLIGGDHSVSLGAIKAYAEQVHPLGLLHIDAHADLRLAYEGFQHSHASIMRNVCEEIPNVTKIVQVGIRDLSEEEFQFIQRARGRISTYFDRPIQRSLQQGANFLTIARHIVSELPSKVYISFDIDGLDPSLCPNTGTPVPGGLTFHQVLTIVEEIVSSGRTIVGFDLTEVAPSQDEHNEWDGNVGARILYKLIGWTLASQGKIATNDALETSFLWAV